MEGGLAANNRIPVHKSIAGKLNRTKNSMTSLDVHSLQSELSILEGAYVDKAFGGEPFSIRFNTDAGKRELVIYDRVFAFLTQPLEKEEGGDIGPLAAAVRKRLGNSRVIAVEHKGFDRVMTLRFSRPEDAYAVIELMGKGNFILVESDKVVSALRYEKRKGHEVFPGSSYTMPSLRFDILTSTFDEFFSSAIESKGDIVRTLASVIGLGGDMAEEVCLRGEVDFRRKPSDMSRDELIALHRLIIDLIQTARERPNPVVYYSGEDALQFTPVPFVRFSELNSREFATLSECVLEFIKHRQVEMENPERERIDRLVEKQTEAIERFRHEMKVTREFADSIYSDYSGFNDLLSAIRKGKGEEHGYRRNIDGTYSTTVAGVDIKLNPSDDINRVASSIYDTSKELERKLKRAGEALDDISSREVSAPAAPAAPRVRKAKKRLWYDSYRWFLSSEGCLVIGGRDARTNDSLVSKHMSDGDRYAHADVYGAPSVVVKWSEAAGEKTLEEACIFALCFSRAWNARIGAASAYWVMPDQVSKTPESGEYLPRGAFVIRGKRNYFAKLNLELGLGVIEHSGESRVVCGPLSAVSAHADVCYRLEPGDKSKEIIASELASRIGVTKDEIVSVLPPGKSSYTQVRGKDAKKNNKLE